MDAGLEDSLCGDGNVQNYFSSYLTKQEVGLVDLVIEFCVLETWWQNCGYQQSASQEEAGRKAHSV